MPGLLKVQELNLLLMELLDRTQSKKDYGEKKIQQWNWMDSLVGNSGLIRWWWLVNLRFDSE